MDAAADATTVRTALRRGRPAEAILGYAADRDADLIAMGTHGRTGLDRFPLGSTAERVVRHADVPVVTVPLAARGGARSSRSAVDRKVVLGGPSSIRFVGNTRRDDAHARGRQSAVI